MKSLIIIILILCAAAGAQTRVTWTKRNYSARSDTPRQLGWNQIRYDALSGKMFWPGGYPSETFTVSVTNGSPVVTFLSGPANGNQFAVPAWGARTGDAISLNGATKNILQGSVTPTQLSTTTNYSACSPGPSCTVTMTSSPSTIYGSDYYWFDLANDLWIHCCGNRSLGMGYITDQPTMPSDRHSYAQTVVDTKRNWIWMTGGAQGTGSPPTSTHTYYMTLHSDPKLNTWTMVTTVNHPGGSTDAGAMMVYDPVHDVVFYWGGSASQAYVFCYTQDNPTPGKTTAAQVAAGCANHDDWTTISGFTPGTNSPSAGQYGYLGYDSATDAAYLFGGSAIAGSVSKNETWRYRFATKSWTRVALSTNTPPIPMSDGGRPPWPPMAYIPTTHKFVYHYQGASPADWVYDPSADTWNTITSVGSGPSTADATFWYSMDFDPNSSTLTAWSEDRSDMWLGVIDVTVAPPRQSVGVMFGAGVIR